MKTISITLNGTRIQLERAGKSRGGRQKYVASSTVRGMPGAQMFLVLYEPEPRALRRARQARAPAAPDLSWTPKPPPRRGPGRPPKATPRVPVPSPPQADDLQSQTLRVLQAMTRRLDALEGQAAAGITQGFHGKRRPRPQPSA